MKSAFRWPARILFLLHPLAFSSPAGAQDIATAGALFDKGVADMKAGRYETGCKAIAESHRLDPRPGTLFTMATCEAQWGNVATAVARYADYLALYERLPSDKKAAQGERPKVAAETRQALLPDVPQLTLSLPKGAPAGTVVKRDGELVADVALGVALPIDPGEHTITVQVPGEPVREQRISLPKGQKRHVILELGAPPTEQPAVETSTGPSGRRVAAYVTGGVGLAGIVAGVVMGGIAIDRSNTLRAHCGGAIGQPLDTLCDSTGLEAAQSGKDIWTGSRISALGGVGLVALGLVLFLTEPTPESRPPAVPAAGKRGPWLSVGLLSAGSEGASLGVSGAF